jgi:hypothetical protein
MKFMLATLAVFLFWGPAANAQVAGGSISGTVTGESGTVMPDVQIAVKGASNGLVRNAITNSAGLYNVPDLSAGGYEMTVSASGFTTQLWTTVTVTAGVERVLNVVMHAGDPQQVVRVIAPPALVSEPCSAACGSSNASTVRDTPLNGRDWAALATLQAGVTGVQSSGGNTERGFGAAISISGARPDQNGFQLDGISINDYSNGAPGSVLGDNLGIDAVEQVSVLGSNYPAAYGRTSGGIINAVTRSGKNTFHGTVYEFLRNSALDARNFFDGPVIPPFKRNQFGASAGLPIQKDRTFIFGDYEGLRQSLGVTTVDTVPSAKARAGNLSTGTVSVDPFVARFLAAFYPVPNGPLLGSGNTGIFSFAGQDITTENYLTVRGDRKLSDKDNLFVTYMRDNSGTVQPGTFNELLTNVVSARQVASVQEQHLFSASSINSIRIGYSRAKASTGGVSGVSNPLMLDSSYAFQPGAFAGSIQNVPGLTSFLGAPSAQGFLPSSATLTWNSFQAGDDFFLTRGRHVLKFGGVVERMQDNQLILGSVNGSFRFASLLNFLTNVPQSFQGNQTIAPPEFGLRQTVAGAYFEDDVRLRPTLTIDLGLRYEMATVLSEAHNRLSNLRNLTDAQPYVGSPLYLNPTLRNFEPRVGFAWNPGGGRTLVRGGFGMFDVLPLPYVFSISVQHGVPFVQEVFGNTIPAGSFPTGAFNQLAGSPGSTRSVYVEHAPKRNYVMQWNFSIARELSSSLALTVGYVGSRGVHQPYKMDNMDMVLPTLTPAGYVWPCGPDGSGNPCATGFLPSGTQASPVPSVRLNPNFGRISGSLWQANSFYDALQVDLAKRVSHGLEFHGAYTWGKSIDTLSATAADDSFPNGLFNQLFFDQRTTRGLSDFNVAQTFVLSFTWELPNPRAGRSAHYTGAITPLRFAAFPNWAVSGWQVGGLYKRATGQPFTPLIGGDPVGMKLEETGQPPDLLGGPGCQTLTNAGNPNNFIKTQCLAFPASATRRGNLGRNTLIGPGLSKLDVSVIKNNRIVRKGGSAPGCDGAGCKSGRFSNLFSEGFNVQFRAEFFNVLNQANFSSPTDNLEVFDKSGQPISGAGLITSTQTTSRQIQVALKLIW